MSSTPTTSSSSNPRYGSIPEQQDRGVGLHPALLGRHIQMIAIGGTIGTGLFLGGPSLAESDTLGMGIEREDAEGEEPFETCSEGSGAVSNASACARNPRGSERGTAGTFPPTREEDDLPPLPPTGSTKSKSNRRKKKSKKGKKQIPVLEPIAGLPSQQVEEH